MRPPINRSPQPSTETGQLQDPALARVAVSLAHHPGCPRRHPDRLVATPGYGRIRVRGALAERGIGPIVPAQFNHPNATRVDGRGLRRYRHCRIAERTPACPGWSRGCSCGTIGSSRSAHRSSTSPV
jgi:hypothetical protein